MASTTQLNSFTDTTLAQHSVNNVNNCVLAPSRSTADCSAGKFVPEPDVSNCITSITFRGRRFARAAGLGAYGAGFRFHAAGLGHGHNGSLKQRVKK